MDYSFNPLVSLLLASNDMIGDLTTVEDEVRPTESQYAIQVGDNVLIASTSAHIDHDLGFGVVVDPLEYQALFPDYEDRLLRSFLLIKWRSRDDNLGDLGWFSRVKLIPISEDQGEQANGWFETGFPEEPDAWVRDSYTALTQELATFNEGVPSPVICPGCGSNNTVLRAIKTNQMVGQVGVVTQNDQTLYVFLGPTHDHEDIGFRITCSDCGANAAVGGDQIGVPSK
jgi:hypothetical protein